MGNSHPPFFLLKHKNSLSICSSIGWQISIIEMGHKFCNDVGVKGKKIDNYSSFSTERTLHTVFSTFFKIIKTIFWHISDHFGMGWFDFWNWFNYLKISRAKTTLSLLWNQKRAAKFLCNLIKGILISTVRGVSNLACVFNILPDISVPSMSISRTSS